MHDVFQALLASPLGDIVVAQTEEFQELHKETFSFGRPTQPLIKILCAETTVATITSRPADGPQDRYQSLIELCTASCALNASAHLLCVDTVVSTSDLTVPSIDALAVVGANNIGLVFRVIPYHTNNNEIQWREDLVPAITYPILPEMVMRVLRFFETGLSIGFGATTTLEYLSRKGHEVILHAPYTMDNISQLEQVK